MKTRRYFQVAAITFALIFANSAPAYCQSPQNSPASERRIQKVKGEVRVIGMGEDVTVVLLSGVEYCGAISKIESDSFEIAEVNLKQMVTIAYADVKEDAVYWGATPRLDSAGRTSQADIQQPQPANPSKALRIFMEEDFSSAQMLKRELTDWSVRTGIPIIFVENGSEAYDLRILLTSGVGSDSNSCSSSCSPSGLDCSPSASCSSSCRVTITLHFVSALALSPDGKLQFTETGVGSVKRDAVPPLARKLAKRLSVLPYAKSTPAK